MPGKELFAGSSVIILTKDEKERREIEDIFRGAGAERILTAGNLLELVLESLREVRPLIVAEAGDSVLKLPDALRYVSEHARYSTVAVISDSWADEDMESMLGLVDVFAVRPVTRRGLLPAVCVDAARKQRMMELERELSRSEESFAKEKNMSFTEHVLMDTLGLSSESAGVYISRLAEKHGYDEGDVARIVYEVMIAGRRS